jgi:hypothetical protein
MIPAVWALGRDSLTCKLVCFWFKCLIVLGIAGAAAIRALLSTVTVHFALSRFGGKDF